MKQNFKRIISMLLALVLCVGLMPGISFQAEAATVNYVYSGSYVYNWGQRGTTATFLSPMAESFYAKNANRSYDYLSSLSGSSTESGVKNSALYKELKSIMSGAATKVTSYNDTRDLFKYTDCQNSGGKISSFYSGQLIGPSWDGGTTWNREHTWPNSKGDAAGSGENDLMMLRPASVSENSSRGNKAYGEGSGYYNPNSESGGTYDLRGDVARIMLFTYTRWGCTNTGSYNPNGIFGTDGVLQSKDIMLKWIKEDPVDTWELGRNDACQSILGTRNIFVDYPELAFVMWGEEIPSDMTTPSGEAEGGAVSYTITATSNNTSYGTVSVSGKTINASPKTGYYVSGYTVISGSAQVTQNGNTFAVVPSSNCSIRINFEARQAFTATFYEDGAKATTKSAYGGDSITLPSHSTSVPDDHKFVGWVTSQVESTESKPATIYLAGSSYTVNGAATFYALYSKFESDGTSTSSDFTLFTDTITEGDYVIYYSGKALVAEINSGTRFAYANVTPSNNTIAEPDESIVWHIAANGNYFTLYNAATGTYAAGNGTNNKAALLTSVTDYARWTITSSNGKYEIVNLGNSSTGKNANLRNNGTYGFATYSTSTGGALTLYKAGSGTTIYTTNVTPACAHEELELLNQKDATCTTNGYTGDWYCADCGQLQQAGKVIKAGHNYELCGDTVECSKCGDIWVGAAYLDGYVYETLDEAIEGANPGQTITMLDHCDSWGIYIDTGICLDLNGFTVMTDDVLCYGSIIDSSNGQGGLLALELLMESSEQLVLYDSQQKMYRFFDYELVSLGTKNYSQGVRFGFALEMTNKDAYTLLSRGNTELDVQVTLKVGTTQKTYAFTDALLQEYAQLQIENPDMQSAMMLNVTGLDALTAGQTLTVTPSLGMVSSSTTATGEAMTYTK